MSRSVRIRAQILKNKRGAGGVISPNLSNLAVKCILSDFACSTFVALFGFEFEDPIVAPVKHLSNEWQVISTEGIGIFSLFSILVESADGDVVSDAVFRFIRPEGGSDAVMAFGTEEASRLAAALLQGGAPGLHIYTLNKSSQTRPIVEHLRSEQLLGK